MKTGKIGVQMMMLKPQIAEHGIYAVLKKLDEMGFHCVEVSQIDMTPETIAQMQQAQKDLNMEIAAMSCGVDDLAPGMPYPGDTLMHNFDKIVADCKAVNCPILRIGMLPMSYATSPEKMMELAMLLEEFALRLKQHQIDLYYHAHTFEFHRWKGKPVLTHMLEATTCLGFELDSHWMWRGGVDPVRYLPLFKGRIRMQHLKDYRIGLMPENFVMKPGFDVFGSLEQYAEVGEGCLDMPAIIQAGLESGSEYFMIEQDQSYGRDVYESLAISRRNLVNMGYEDWF